MFSYNIVPRNPFSKRKGKGPEIEIIVPLPGESTGKTKNSEMIFVMDGESCLESDVYPPIHLDPGYAVFLPAGTQVTFHNKSVKEILRISFDPYTDLCAYMSIIDIAPAKPSLWSKILTEQGDKLMAGTLEVRGVLVNYLHNLRDLITEGFNLPDFIEIKVNEFFSILSASYTSDELSRFFNAILNEDTVFASFVLRNWHKVRNAKEFAAISTYCETNFGRRFKRIFGVSPYKWLNERKAAMIRGEICSGSKSLKEISDEFHFNSLQQFNDYCRKNFHMPPGKMRRKHTQNPSLPDTI